MNHRRSGRVFGAAMGLVLAGALPVAALASHGTAQQPAALHQPAFVAGREGGNIRPSTVTIYSDGTVSVSGAGAGSSHPQLSKDALDGLMKLARAEGFFTLPGRIIGHGLPDISGRYITIHSAGSTKTVHVRFVQNAAFDQLYAVLMAVAGQAS